MIPSERMTKPVPTPLPGCTWPNAPSDRVELVTFTTAGATRLTTETMGSPWRSGPTSGLAAGREGVGPAAGLPLVRVAEA